MTQQTKKILIIGATGHQGGAVARQLLERGYQALYALVRSADHEQAQALETQGVKLVTGDLDDPASLQAALTGMDGVFYALPLEGGIELEVRRGKAVADAAKQAGLQHVVYSSVGGAERSLGVRHFQTKYAIENYIRDLGIPASIVRPVSFMDNFGSFNKPQLKDGALVVRMALHPDTQLQLIAVHDIGMVVADMFDKPGKYLGKAIEIAGDELTGPQIAAAFAKATGQPARFEEQPIAEIQAFNSDIASMFTWLNDHGYNSDIPALRQQFPTLMTFETWLQNNYKD